MSILESPVRPSLPNVIRSLTSELIVLFVRAKNLLVTRLVTDGAPAVRFLGLET